MIKKTWERQKIWIPMENGWDYRLETDYEADIRARRQLQWYQEAINFYKASVWKAHDVQQQPMQAMQVQERMLQQQQMQMPQQQMQMQMQQEQMQPGEIEKWKRLTSAAAALAIAKPTQEYLEEQKQRKAMEKARLARASCS